MKRSPIKRRSAKREAEMQERRVVLGQIVAERGPRCQFPACKSMADDGHEILSRAAGGSITDPFNILLLCRPHHTWATDHPLQATRLGLAKSRYLPKEIGT